jgi:8-oxo-dGTP diphosphatase
MWAGRRVTFRPRTGALGDTAAPAAALVFAFHGRRIVLADIAGRGWCVPSGRLEVGERAEEAARREAWEEAGVTLGALVPLGEMISLEGDGAEVALASAFLATVERFDALPAESESLGVRLAAHDELAACYFQWDELIAALFEYAWARSLAPRPEP